jgi:hypothetical protein
MHYSRGEVAKRQMDLKIKQVGCNSKPAWRLSHLGSKGDAEQHVIAVNDRLSVQRSYDSLSHEVVVKGKGRPTEHRPD